MVGWSMVGWGMVGWGMVGWGMVGWGMVGWNMVGWGMIGFECLVVSNVINLKVMHTFSIFVVICYIFSLIGFHRLCTDELAYCCTVRIS